MRLTRHRKSILSLLKNNKTPMNADEIMTSFEKGVIDLSTVYRSLNILHSAGMISKSVVNNTSYYFLSNQEHHHFMICLNCEKMFELNCLIGDTVKRLEKESGFQIIQHDLTFYGYCPACQMNN